MKLFTLFLSLFSLSLLAGLPPTTLVGTDSGESNVFFKLKVPNAQSTKLADGAIIETGNENILANPSFESSRSTTGYAWSVTGATASLDTTNQIHGKNALSLSLSSTLNLNQSATTNVANTVGLQAVASIYVKSSLTDVSVCSIINSVEDKCVLYNGTNTWAKIEIPFIFGATQNGIKVKTTSSTTGTVLVDNAFVGLSSPFQNVNGAKLVGTVTITGCTSAWSTTSTSFADFAAQTGCVYTTSGQAQAPSTNLPAIKFSSLPAGDYLIQYEGLFGNTNNSQQAYYQFSDGTNTSRETTSNFMAVSTGTAYALGNSMSHSISYSTSQSNITLSIKSKVSGGTSQLYGLTTTPSVIKVWYFPPESKIYSQASQDYGWTSYTPTFGAGMGTVTGTSCFHKRRGSNLDVSCSFVMGTPANLIYSITLPSGLIIDSTKITTTNTITSAGQEVGTWSQNAATGKIVTAMGTSTSTLYLGGISANWLTPQSSVAAFNAIQTSINFTVPIQGWQDYGVIVGSFAGIEKCANDYECTDTFSARVSSTGVVSGENIDWINGNCSVATSNYTCTLNTNLKDGISGLSSPLNCVVDNDQAGVIIGHGFISNSTTAFTYQTYNSSSGAASAQATILTCHKSTNDYKPKTAKVASSIGVPTVPGISTSGTGNSIDYGMISFGATSSTICSTVSTNCAYLDQIGNMFNSTSGVFHGASAGNYTLNMNKTYSKFGCVGSLSGASLPFVSNQIKCTSCNTLSFTTPATTTGTNGDVYGTLFCTGSY